MLVQDVIEEIVEKSSQTLSMMSLLRKITQVRDRLVRDYGPVQERESVCTGFDLVADKALYILPCPPRNVLDVELKEILGDDKEKWRRIPHLQFNRETNRPFYYFVDGRIGLWPVPKEDLAMGVKVFHIPVLTELTPDDLDKPTGFDPDFDTLLVYGVLKEIEVGNAAMEYDLKYRQLLDDYQRLSGGFDGQIYLESW